MELLPQVESAVDSLLWDRADPVKRLAALQVLLLVSVCEPGVEAIKAHGGIDRLRKALQWDEDAMEVAAKALAACSGSTARGPGVRVFTFTGSGEHAHVTHAVRVRETDYVQGGLGWRVWASGVVMCRELIQRTAEKTITIKNQIILELGAGCGVVGFLCAKLGATAVTFTDYLPGRLVNLDKSVELQREDEDGETCSTSTSETNETNASRETRFRVKHLEWLASDPVLHNQWKQKRPMGGDGSCSANELQNENATRNRSLAPDETFSLILGSDVCYDDPLPRALAATICKKLANPGLAWLVLPVRDWPDEPGFTVIDKLVESLKTYDPELQITVEKAPDLRDEEYEGGTFVRHALGMVSVWVRRDAP